MTKNPLIFSLGLLFIAGCFLMSANVAAARERLSGIQPSGSEVLFENEKLVALGPTTGSVTVEDSILPSISKVSFENKEFVAGRPATGRVAVKGGTIGKRVSVSCELRWIGNAGQDQLWARNAGEVFLLPSGAFEEKTINCAMPEVFPSSGSAFINVVLANELGYKFDSKETKITLTKAATPVMLSNGSWKLESGNAPLDAMPAIDLTVDQYVGHKPHLLAKAKNNLSTATEIFTRVSVSKIEEGSIAVVQDGDSVPLESGASKDLDIFFPEIKEQGIYSGTIQLFDVTTKKPVSNILGVRYIAKEKIGAPFMDILDVNLDKPSYQTGDIAKMRIVLEGSAANVEGGTDVEVSAIVSKDGVTAATFNATRTLEATLVEASVPVEKIISDPAIAVTIKRNGLLLSEYTVNGPQKKVAKDIIPAGQDLPSEQNLPGVLILVGVLVLVIAIIVLIALKKGGKGKNDAGARMLCAIGFFALVGCLSAASVLACKTLSGDVCESGYPNVYYWVEFYLDSPSNYIGMTWANVFKSGLGAECGGNSNHSFSYTLPATTVDGTIIADGNTHSLIVVSKKVSTDWFPLAGSPVSFSCPVTCSCNSWTNGSCAAGGCSATQRQQTTTCNPVGCGSTSRCVADASCTACTCGTWTNGSCGAGGCLATQRQQTTTCNPVGCGSTSRCVADASCAASNVTISGRVTNNSGAGLSGVAIDTCGASVTTDANGNWSRTVASGTGYCARISSGLPAGYTAIRGTFNNSCYPNASTYEWQVAGQNQYVNCSYTDQRAWDLNSDASINFVVDYPPACACGTWTNGSCAAGGCLATQRQQTTTCNPVGCGSTSRCVADASCTACTCGTWTNGSCGAGGCLATQRQQTTTCNPVGCGSTSRCVADAACGTPPDLSLTFQVNPWSGNAPLNSVMTATVGGTAVGTINYTAWWNCNNMCTTVAACQTACGAWDDKADGVVSNVRILNHTYAVAGTYYAKMVVERQSMTTQGKVQVIVGAGPTFTVSLAASPSTGAAPLATTLTSTLGGTATGNSNYTYWWNCNNACATVAACQTACGAFDAQQLNLAGTTNSLSHTYAAAGSFTPKVVAERAGLSAESRAAMTVLAPLTLTVALGVAPISGNAPLTTSLTATVSGTATGTINYTTWWNCNNACATVAACQTACGAWDDKADNVAATTRNLNHTYATVGTFTPKIIVERASLTAEDRETITVSAASTLSVALTASPTSGSAPLATSLTATVLGTATGTINYTTWWNCNNACATVAACQTACGAFDAQQLNLAGTTNSLSHTYAAAGSFTPKVVAERAGLSAESRAALTVLAPLTLTVALGVAPISGNAPLTTSLTATISGTATGTINYTTWWNCNNACATVAACQTACGAWDDKADNVTATTRNLNHTYATVGTFTPKIIVERASLTAEDSATVDVTNGLPTADTLTKQSDFCGSGLSTIFSWTYSDPENDPQTYRQVQVDDNADFSSPVDDSGKIGTASPSYVTLASKLAYDTTYHWRLKVWDSNGNDSGWIGGSDFSTPQHTYPAIAFIWSPATPKEDTEITYTDQTQVFGGATVSARSWVIQGATPGTSVAEEFKVIYAVKGDFTTTLTVTDSSGYTCSLQKAIKVKSGIPDWEEL